MASFARRHIGTFGDTATDMLRLVGASDLDDLMDRALPHPIAGSTCTHLPAARSEEETADALAAIAAENHVMTSMIGQGFYDTVLPAVIRRGILENPSWYTAYTPYQPEISQGRLEALLNFQTMISSLTGLDIADASLLDEASAAAEAMLLALRITKGERAIAVDRNIFQATADVLRNRAEAAGVSLTFVDIHEPLELGNVSALIMQYPGASGELLSAEQYAAAARAIHHAGGKLIVLADPLALTVLAPPADFGADIVAGSVQRLGLPMSGGGPHAGYIATSLEWERQLPGRLVGVSRDSQGHPAYRLALQTREQHIRRERATSNICTAQALLAIISSMYAVYHGPDGLREIARRVHDRAAHIAQGLAQAGLHVASERFFDTVELELPGKAQQAAAALHSRGILVYAQGDCVRLSADERTTEETCGVVIETLAKFATGTARQISTDLPGDLRRSGELLSDRVFHEHHSETEMMRYMRRLAAKDYALDRGMIPLGSCTMKLNAAVEMTPITYEGFARIHPYAPREDQQGYVHLVRDLENWLIDITGYDAVSVQPNAGSQGELSGLLAIRGFYESRGETERNVCLIPASAHGTNAASAALAGFTVAVVKTAADGSIDSADLDAQLARHAGKIGAIMITYPSTFGTFEADIPEVIEKVHAAGGQVYIDGANLNALVGYAGPGLFGGDVSHLNLHKTFAIPHGGGGPGVGPVAAKAHLAPFLPGFRGRRASERPGFGAVTSAPWGSAGVLPISWAYISLMGRDGLWRATASAVLAANYVAARMEGTVPVLYRGPGGFVGHECILDMRQLRTHCGITVDDVAKRLIDYGFHAPTMSFPVTGTLMVEPTESEDKDELDRFCDAMIAIVREAERVGAGEWPADDNPLKNAPHTAESLLSEPWNHPYSRQEAAYPGAAAAKHNGRDPEYVRALVDGKYWPPVGRIDGPWGDRHLICTCPPPEAFAMEDGGAH